MLYELKIELADIEPSIWRIIQVPSSTRLSKLHRIIQRTMGWQNCHVYEFHIKDKEYGEPSPDWGHEVLNSRKITLEEIFGEGAKSFRYEYDLGDGWMHRITFRKIVPGEEKLSCVAGARACPPEDCGGSHGYYRFLTILSDPDHKEHEEMAQWIGDDFDPSAFDIDVVNQDLRRLR